LQSLIRKNQLFQTARVISDTHCFIRVFGFGISGRIFAPGGNTSRLLLIEAYSSWNSTTYTLHVPGPSIKHLLQENSKFCEPGHKIDLLRSLVDLLYFDYTIKIHPQHSMLNNDDNFSDTSTNLENTDKVSESNSVKCDKSVENNQENGINEIADNGNNQTRRSEGTDSVIQKANENDKQSIASGNSNQNSKSANPIESHITVLNVHHIEPFSLPELYPQNIADIIGNITAPPAATVSAKVELFQTLKISKGKKETGPIVRRREMLARLQREREEEERKRREWQAIPRRLKGKFAGKAIRRNSKFFVLCSYRMPTRPNICTIRCLVAESCEKLGHNIEIRSVGREFGISIPPMNWTNQTLRMVVLKISKELDVVATVGEPGCMYIKHRDRTGPDVKLRPNKSCVGWDLRERSIPIRRQNMFPAKFYRTSLPLNEEPSVWFVSSSALGKNSERRHPMWCTSQCKPRRDIGRIRITTRGKKINNNYGLYSLYILSHLCKDVVPDVQEIEEQIISGKFGNIIVPKFLGPQFKLEIEISMQASEINECDSIKSVMPCNVQRVVFNRSDLCRLVSDKKTLRVALRIGHSNFYESASAEEIRLVETAWNAIGDYLLSICRWTMKSDIELINDVRSKPLYNNMSLKHKVIHASNLLGIDAAIATRHDSMQSRVPILRWSSLIYSKFCKVPSESPTRSDTMMQVILDCGINVDFY
jgi:hypothetical protein